MKKFILINLLLMAFVFIGSIYAQVNTQMGTQEEAPIKSTKKQKHLELTPIYGYQFEGIANTYDGEFRVGASEVYGGNLEVVTPYGANFFATYTYQPTDISYNSYYGYNPGLVEDYGDLNVHYMQIGGVREFSNKKVRPYGRFTLGATVFSPAEEKYDEEWFFSMTMGLGAKIDLSDKIAINLYTNLLVPMRFSGGGIWFGTGGASVGVGTYAYFIQGNIGGGLTFSL
jgi:opacity protein-like surface antigen